MKNVLSLLVILVSVPCASPQAVKEKPPALAQVKASGTVAEMRLEITKELKGGKLVEKTISVLTVELQNNLPIQVKLPRFLSADELIPLARHGVVVEGALKTEGKELILVCDAWERADGDKGKSLPAGTVPIAGKAVQGKHAYGKDKESPLAIENGAKVIIVDGALTKEQAELQGSIRIAGKLRLDEKGVVFVETDKAEKVKTK